MADKAISELVEATSITHTDLLVMEQNNTAKKISGQTLINFLTAIADGHGGIQSLELLKSSGLVDTYRITLADTTIFDFTVTNGRAIASITQTSVSGLTRTYTIAFNDGATETFSVTDGRSITKIAKTASLGLVDTYTITYNDGTTGTYTVTNGEKGDTGDSWYVWIKYASQEPTAESHSIGNLPDDWMGVYSGTLPEAPDDWTLYSWFQIKGEKGDTGDPATLEKTSVEYQASDSGTILPSGSWSTSIPVVAQGRYLWTRTTLTFNTGSPVVYYSISRMGLDGLGSVVSVADISPDADGNVPLSASDIGALPDTGGDLTGELNMNGQPISGLNEPTQADHAANMGYVDQQVKKAAPRNLLDNSFWASLSEIVNQRGQTSYSSVGYTIDRWWCNGEGTLSVNDGNISMSLADGSPYFDLAQTLENGERLTGKLMTFAVKTQEYGIKLVNFTFGANDAIESGDLDIFNYGNLVYIRSRTTTTIHVEWAALYEGEYTLETLPEYRPKGYGAELAECQRYFLRLPNTTDRIEAVGIASDSRTIIATLYLPVIMRIAPTVIVHDVTAWTARVGATSGLALQSVQSEGNTTFCHFVISTATSVEVSAPAIIYAHRIDISADL